MDNMEIYNRVRSVPDEAKKTIGAGRLKGFTDINPMWRIKALTETFGPCGLGWWYVIKDKRLEQGLDNEIRAFVDIDLFYRWNGETSQPVPGTGGSSFVTVEKNGPYCSDECFKMALTDAISTAAKAIGVAADVYYAKDRSKYTAQEEAKPLEKCELCGSPITDKRNSDGRITKADDIIAWSMKNAGMKLCGSCVAQYGKQKAQEAAQQQKDEYRAALEEARAK